MDVMNILNIVQYNKKKKKKKTFELIDGHYIFFSIRFKKKKDIEGWCCTVKTHKSFKKLNRLNFVIESFNEHYRENILTIDKNLVII